MLLVQVAGAGFDLVKEVAECNLRHVQKKTYERREETSSQGMFDAKEAVELQPGGGMSFPHLFCPQEDLEPAGACLWVNVCDGGGGTGVKKVGGSQTLNFASDSRGAARSSTP